MSNNEQENNIIKFKRPMTKQDEENALNLANKIKVINELADEGIISQKERLRIINMLVN
jgi:hypothetical protein